MDLKTVKQLADLMEQYGLASAEVTEGEHTIVLSKAMAVTAPVVPSSAAVAAPPAPAAPGEAAASSTTSAPAAPGEELKSPLVGVAYLCPKPGAKPFIAKGQQVKKGDTLCIVEAMKVMNEFTAPRDGTVSEICIEDGQLVEYGQRLFQLL